MIEWELTKTKESFFPTGRHPPIAHYIVWGCINYGGGGIGGCGRLNSTVCSTWPYQPTSFQAFSFTPPLLPFGCSVPLMQLLVLLMLCFHSDCCRFLPFFRISRIPKLLHPIPITVYTI